MCIPEGFEPDWTFVALVFVARSGVEGFVCTPPVGCFGGTLNGLDPPVCLPAIENTVQFLQLSLTISLSASKI